MRVLLASIECPKGDLRANVEGHLAVIDQARQERCELAVFPEFSLTGAVDPSTHPERAITLEHPAVEEIVTGATRHGVAAVFGLSERIDHGFSITQAYTVDGQVRGVQRKRHLGEGEGAYTPTAETAVFDYGSALIGAVICAESTVDSTWDRTREAGADLVVFCSAPGLHGRRIDEAGWRDGFDWWERAGLADARRHAERLGVWVAMCTQAGVTEDEDFPGIAALIDPSGDIVDRLPDWRPGTLAVDIPVTTDVEPVRRAIRVLVVDEAGRALLAEFCDDTTGRRWWVPPGGGIEGDETDLECARRELQEEVGRVDLTVGPPIGRRGGSFPIEGRWLTQYERWYLSRCRHFDVAEERLAAVREEGIRNFRWWSSSELRSTGVLTGPRDLADLLDSVTAGDLPDEDSDLGR